MTGNRSWLAAAGVSAMLLAGGCVNGIQTGESPADPAVTEATEDAAAQEELQLPLGSLADTLHPMREALLRSQQWSELIETAEPFTPELDPDRPGFLVTPFTAEQIAAACTDGTHYEMFRSHQRTGNTANDWLSQASFDKSTSDRVEVSLRLLASEGTPEEPADARSTTWEALRLHASFSAERTKAARTMCESPFGRLRCTRYHVEVPPRPNADNPGTLTIVFYFADSLPGPPVRMEYWHDGVRTQDITMVSRWTEVPSGR